jgi:hypothetical protein
MGNQNFKTYLLHTKLETYFSGGAGKWPQRLALNSRLVHGSGKSLKIGE